MRTHLMFLSLVAGLLTTIGCDSTEPDTGGIRVSVSTSGGDLDIDGYAVHLDGEPQGRVPTDGARDFTPLPTGAHDVELREVASNCAVTSDNPRRVVVSGGQNVVAAFLVNCVATGVEVTTATTGIDFPDSGNVYVLRIEGVAPHSIPANGRVAITRLRPGTYEVALSEVTSNCTVSGENPRSVTVSAGVVVPVTFSAACVAAYGSIEITAVTSGTDIDPNGFQLQLDEGPAIGVASNGTYTFDRVEPGDRTLALGGVATNCTVGGDATRSLTVTAGGTKRDTVRTSFDISCALASPKIAFTRDGGSIMVARGDSSNIVSLASGYDPAWSPDGERIAFTVPCDDYYYYYGYCYNPAGLYVINDDGTAPTQVTTDDSDGTAAWRPDGAKIAFTRRAQVGPVDSRSRLYLVNPDGSSAAALPLPAEVRGAFDPAWSPDGLVLAFSCEIDEGNLDICLVNVDGTGFQRLTDDPARDAVPAWKPDGSSIAFATTRFTGTQQIAVMNADGSAVSRLATATGATHPAWSADGAKIVFSSFVCDISSGCRTLGLSLMNQDGTELITLTRGNDDAPAWRP